MIEFFTREEGNQIIAAIKEAEQQTSGEIRVHLEVNSEGNILDVTKDVFHKIGMHQTEARNGVLILLAPDRQEFAILGDEGINSKVEDHFWDDVRDIMQQHFKTQDFVIGLEQAILRVGEKLKAFFPYQTDDVNELSDDISYGQG